MKRRLDSRIPGENGLFLRMFPSIFQTAMDGLSPQEAGVLSLRFGITDGEPKTLDEIGKVNGVTRERIRQIESRGMAKLREVAGDAGLGDFTDLDFQTLGALLGKRPEPGLIKCERHGGWREDNLHPSRVCQGCDCSLPFVPWFDRHGRTQRYCTNSCKQAAYRRRKKSAIEKG